MSIRELKLTDEQHRWLDGWLELWGAWVATGKLGKEKSSIIAQYMATVTPPDPSRAVCSDDDGVLISEVVDSILKIDKKALDLVTVYYSRGVSKRAMASYYLSTATPRKMAGRGGISWRKPSLITCRREVDEILNAALWVLYQPLLNAFKSRKRVAKVKKVGWNVLTLVSH